MPFYVAGAFFAISALTSFIAPCLKKSSKEEEPAGEGLTPIDEDDEEEDGPITMGGRKVPEIVETASSPGEREIKQIESVL